MINYSFKHLLLIIRRRVSLFSFVTFFFYLSFQASANEMDVEDAQKLPALELSDLMKQFNQKLAPDTKNRAKKAIEIRVYKENENPVIAFQPLENQDHDIIPSDPIEIDLPAEGKHQELSLKISCTQNFALSASPPYLEIQTIHQQVFVQFDEMLQEQAQNFFVRNEKVLDWNKEQHTLTGTAPGSTEIYFVANGQILIIPVKIQLKGELVHTKEILENSKKKLFAKNSSTNVNQPNLPSIHKSLFDLSNEMPILAERVPAGFEPNMLIKEREMPSKHDLADESGYQDAAEELMTIPEERHPIESASKNIESYDENSASNEQEIPRSPSTESAEENSSETGPDVLSGEELNTNYQSSQNEQEELQYESMEIQVVDDRTNPEEGRVYPVNDASIKVIGTNYSVKTDVKGRASLRGIPRNSSILVSVDDPLDRVKPGVFELSGSQHQVSSENLKITKLKMMRLFTLNGFAEIAGLVQESTSSSLCGTIKSYEAQVKRLLAREFVSMKVDTRSDGVFYFNKFGFLDRSLSFTSSNGRFCIFNLEPGPASLSFFEQTGNGQESLTATIPISLFAGRHLEQDFDLSSSIKEEIFKTRLATAATAQEQLSSNREDADRLRPVDYIDLIPFGESTPLILHEDGIVKNGGSLTIHGNKIQLFSDAAEFEPTIYSFDIIGNITRSSRSRKGIPLTTLLPRGFIEDMALYAQVALDLMLGSVFVEFGDIEGSSNSLPIKISLFNEMGQSVGDAWHYKDRPFSKALFFNVPPGIYVVFVETSDETWLAAQTVTVFNQTVSYVSLGSKIKN